MASPLLIHELYRVTRGLMRDYNERFLTVGVTAQQYLLLHQLLDHPRQSARSLASQCGLDRATITNLMNQLEGKRLIKRVIDLNDRRSISVDLTPAGRQLALKLQRLAQEFNELLTSRLGPRAAADILELIGQLG